MGSVNLDEYKRWRDKRSTESTLWLYATKGYGKSVIAAYAVEDLMKIRRDSSVVTYFFCKRDNTYLSDSNLVIRSFLRQVTAEHPAGRARCKVSWEEYLEPHEDSETSPEATVAFRKIVTDTVTAVLETTQTIYFVVDGLNECESATCKRIID